MKLSPQKLKESSSATIPQTLWLIVGFSLVLVAGACANQPEWWIASGAVTDTNNSTTNNSIAVNLGQVKQFTARAVDELNANLSGGAGAGLNTMVSNWSNLYLAGNYGASNPDHSDYQAANVGQLKYIGKLVWSQLLQNGYGVSLPSWLNQTNAGDYSLANIGQLKTVFNFDFSLSTPTALTSSTNSSGTINVTWTLPTVNNASEFLLEQQTQDGSWEIIANLASTATSYSVTGLGNGENPTFQIISSNNNDFSNATPTVPDIGIVAPSNVQATPGGAGEIDVTWVNNSTDATYTQIEESVDGVNWSVIATLTDTTTTSYAVTGLNAEQNYYFGVASGNN